MMKLKNKRVNKKKHVKIKTTTSPYKAAKPRELNYEI
jgi:hypothetical protein